MSRWTDEDRLRLIGAALALNYFLTFVFWFPRSGLSAAGWELGNHVPMWPLEGVVSPLPDLVTRTLMRLLGLLSLATFLLFYRRFGLALKLLAVLFIAKLGFYLLDLRLAANFHHAHLILTLLFLVSRDRLLFFRVGLAVVYWLAALSKLTPSWLEGEYFRSVPAGLPLIPEALIWPASLAVLTLETVGPLLWLTRWARWSVYGFLAFHLYSGIIVGFWYTTLMLPLVVGALWEMQPVRLRTGWEWSLVALFLAGGCVQLAIPGDVRVTAEGRYFGLFMFDANRRVVADLEVDKGSRRYRFEIEFDWPQREVLDWRTRIRMDGREVREPVRDGSTVILNPLVFRQSSSRMFGDPYLYYAWARSLEERYHPDRIGIKLRTQLDGHPEEIVVMDVRDFAREVDGYRPAARNPWIRW